MWQVKVIDESHEKDLEESVNEFLAKIKDDVIEVQYRVALAASGEDQLYIFSAMIIYKKG